jgi:gluconolactonase
MEGKVTALADNYKGKKFNQPNDLWRHPSGGIYFSDPYYGDDRTQLELDVEGVYYLPPDGSDPVRVVDDMVRPNGLIGTPDGKTIYITDNGGGITWRYSINADGTLSDKTFFAAIGADGMTLDEKGNLYLAGDGITVLDTNGELIERIDIPANWSANITFGGPDKKTLFVTAGDALYRLKMNVKGI